MTDLSKYNGFPILKKYMELEACSRYCFDAKNPAAKERMNFFHMYKEDIFREGKRFNVIDDLRKKMGGDYGIHKTD